MIQVCILINGVMRHVLTAKRLHPLVTKARPTIPVDTICRYVMRRQNGGKVEFLHRYGDGPEVLARLMLEHDQKAARPQGVPL